MGHLLFAIFGTVVLLGVVIEKSALCGSDGGSGGNLAIGKGGVAHSREILALNPEEAERSYLERLRKGEVRALGWRRSCGKGCEEGGGGDLFFAERMEAGFDVSKSVLTKVAFENVIATLEKLGNESLLKMVAESAKVRFFPINPGDSRYKNVVFDLQNSKDKGIIRANELLFDQLGDERNKTAALLHILILNGLGQSRERETRHIVQAVMAGNGEKINGLLGVSKTAAGTEKKSAGVIDGASSATKNDSQIKEPPSGGAE